MRLTRTSIVVIGSVLLLTGSATQAVYAQRCTAVLDGTVGWWPGDGNAEDFVGEHHGILHWNAGFAPALAGEGFELGGGLDAVFIPRNGTFNFGTGSFTVQAWVNLRARSPSGFSVALSQREHSSDLAGWALMRSDNGLWRFEVGDRDGIRDFYDAFSDRPAAMGEFVHLVGMIDRAANRVKLYVNGELQNFSMPLDDLGSVTNEGSFWIGRVDVFQIHSWVGLVDEVALFDRALSDAEVRGLYESGLRGMCRRVEVGIDVRPGTFPNPLNLAARGVLPVAILSDELFDATRVDPETIQFAGASVATGGQGRRWLAHVDDVNGDGLDDLLVQIEIQGIDPLQLLDGMAFLTGLTIDELEFEGVDELRLVGRGRR